MTVLASLGRGLTPHPQSLYAQDSKSRPNGKIAGMDVRDVAELLARVDTPPFPGNVADGEVTMTCRCGESVRVLVQATVDRDAHVHLTIPRVHKGCL